ncbi:cysteine rich repeat-containing protein [Bdellovibrio bacteriovorus]|uniref:Uncharacterized protein n=1 Tax=Bdellovibrio bacteriovorus TaxID=959 RepID=A0A150WHF3_BDEBC|nr:cysteine rich repeat-containing protein [Bdellovibrio bacteriovorus]KYG62515.1 hypothetical protein AZI85_05765 [Bdellovibrio bacteriovorus]
MNKYVAVCVMVLGMTSFAQAHQNGGGACDKDRESLCAGVEPGGGRIAKCLHENKEKVSAECKAHLESAREKLADMKEACHEEAEKYCGDVKPGKGRILKCMKEHKDKLSAACKEEIASAKEMRKKRK